MAKKNVSKVGYRYPLFNVFTYRCQGNPQPNPAEITTAVEAVGGSKEAVLQLQMQVKQLDSILSQVAKYVEFAANGDASKIISAGMEVKAKPSPIGPMPRPAGFKVAATDNPGEFVCNLQAIKGAVSYIYQYTLTPETESSWVISSIASKSRAVISGLISGNKYSFRCAAVGAAGQGPWSDVVQRYAL